MIARFWSWLFDLPSPRASALSSGAHSAETAARVLQAQAEQSLAYARTLPIGPARDLARMQAYEYDAKAAMYRAEAGGDEFGAKLHASDAEYWAARIEARIGQEQARAAEVVDLTARRVQQMREAGL